MTVEIRKASCYFCHMNCGMLAHVEDEKIIKIEGDPEHPFNLGARCPRGAAALEHLNHPARVNYPLKRVGERGENRWERISWEQAWDEIADKLQKIKDEYGAEAIASSGGTNRTDDWVRRRFFNLLGSPNIIHTAPVCWIPNFLTETAIYGYSAFDPEVNYARCVVVWGHNPAASYVPEMRNMLESRQQAGQKIIVIDPKYTDTAARADLWLPIRPGTDNALALAWLHIIINEGWFDEQFVEDWTIGFDELCERVMDCTPEWAEEITGVPAEKIYQAAQMYAMLKPACIQWGVACDQLGRATTSIAHARACLRAITGNLDIPGGDVMPGPHPTFTTDVEMELNDRLPEEQRAKQLGADQFKLMAWPGYELLTEQVEKVWGKGIPAEWMCEAHPPAVWTAILEEKPYPVKAMITLANNPLISYANSRRIYEALKKLDLHVVVDYWLTPSAVMADYVLPAASWMERPVMTTVYGVSDWLVASQAAIKPMYERKTDYEFWRGLGLRLGQEQEWPWQTLEEVNHYRLDTLGYEMGNFDEFVENIRMDFAPRYYMKYLEQGFATPSGKVELKSSILEQLGGDGLPRYEEPSWSPVSSPELLQEYPLVLTAGAGFMPYFHSEHRQLKTLRLIRPYPVVHINPRTAEQYGIQQGDWVYIESPNGRIKQKANLTEQIATNVVQAERGWWYPERDAAAPELYGAFESNVNVLTDDAPESCDPLSGSWSCKALLCKIYKVQEGI